MKYLFMEGDELGMKMRRHQNIKYTTYVSFITAIRLFLTDFLSLRLVNVLGIKRLNYNTTSYYV
jgi:hypothetical protein